MKKILLAFDGGHFSKGAFEFARRLNAMEPVLLTGVFLPQTDYSNLWSYSAGTGGHLLIPMLEDDDVMEVEENIEQFETACNHNGIEYRVHKYFTDFALPGLKKETRFADLLILGCETFYENLNKRSQSDFLRDALHEAECPVLVVPEEFTFPEKNILAYDGSDSSVFAMKQFAYIFPEFTGNATMLVYANTGKEKGLPDEAAIEELAARHYQNLDLFTLDINPEKYFINWVSENKGSVLVCGSFGRSAFSQLIKKSFVSNIICERKLPVFIAHR